MRSQCAGREGLTPPCAARKFPSRHGHSRLLSCPRPAEGAAMSRVTIYHNPRCTKSRQTLELLRGRGIEPTIVEYLNDPPDEAAIGRLLDLLGLEPIDLIRKGEPLFKELGLAEV